MTAVAVVLAVFVGQVSFSLLGWQAFVGTAVGFVATCVWIMWPRRLELGESIPVIGRDEPAPVRIAQEETIRFRRGVRP